MSLEISIKSDKLAEVQAMLLGAARGLAELETGPAVTSDQAPSDIVQQEELPLTVWSPFVTDNACAVEPVAEGTATVHAPEPQPEPKKRGRRPKVEAAPVADIEPSVEALTEEEEPEAEGAVDTAEPAKDTATGVTEEQLREKVRGIMRKHGMQAAIDQLKKGGYRAVSEVPPEDYARVYDLISAG